MGAITDWRDALEDPRFWACYYTVDDEVREEAFGTTYQQLEPYYLRMIGCDDLPEIVNVPEVLDAVEGSIIHIPFPEDFHWDIEIRASGEHHTLYHPHYWPTGLPAGLVSETPCLPSLRWRELWQCAVCAEVRDFRPTALVPLFFPLIALTEDDDLAQVRTIVGDAWSELDVVAVNRLDYWLEHLIRPSAPSNTWLDDPLVGWRATSGTSVRAQGSRAFAPFLEMLDRQVGT